MKKYYEEHKKIYFKKLEGYTNQLKVMAHPVRYSILIMLSTNKKMTVTQIYEELGLEQATISNHLKILKSMDLVGIDKNGKNKFYWINGKSIVKLFQNLNLGDFKEN